MLKNIKGTYSLMRILLELKSLQNAEYRLIHNYIIQGFIYNLLKDTEFAWLHSYKGFKYFNFSNIFPVEDFKIDKEYRLIISSPNKKLIRILARKLKELKGKEIKLGSLSFILKKIKVFDLKLRFPWETATPIILRKGKEAILTNGFQFYKVFLKDINILKELGFKKEKIKIEIRNPKEISINDLKTLDKNKFRVIKIKDVYYSFEKGDSLFQWLEDLKKQSLLKYHLFTSSEIYFEEPLFDELEFRKEVAVVLRLKNRGEVIYIGSLWKKLSVLRKLSISEKKFYKFLLDCGLGSLNSLGFGFVNIKWK